MCDFEKQMNDKIRAIKNSSEYKRLNLRERNPSENNKFNTLKEQILMYKNLITEYHNDQKKVVKTNPHRLPPKSTDNIHTILRNNSRETKPVFDPYNTAKDRELDHVEGPFNSNTVYNLSTISKQPILDLEPMPEEF